MKPRPIRILLCKPGLDGHDRGVKVIARACRDAGMEVIYGGVRQTVKEIAAIAAQEDPDVIGVSNHSGVLPELCAELQVELEGVGLSDVPLVAGGTLTPEDVGALAKIGVRGAFGPGTEIPVIVGQIAEAGGQRALQPRSVMKP